MSLLPDHQILMRCASEQMIVPFVSGQVKHEDGQSIVSYGVSSYGYDIRLARGVKIFTNAFTPIVDPKNFDPRNFVENDERVPVIPPNSFMLGHTMERLKIPRDILVIAIGKSTYARCGIVANVTPLEPEWEGTITLEISNTTPNPARVYTGEGICQLVFFKADATCDQSYKDRKGKYQGQEGTTLAKV